MSNPHTFDMEMYCEKCERETNHHCYSDGHERDSSWDRDQCTVCGWTKLGMGGGYYDNDDEQEGTTKPTED